jgi:hypothetical protein
MPMLIVSCVNGKAAKALVAHVREQGNTNADTLHAVAYIPADDETYANTVLNHAFDREWVTGGEFAHAMTTFRNKLLDGKE